MPLKATKRKAKAAVGDDDDLRELPGDRPRKRTRTYGSRIDEDSEETGRKANKHFQSWAEWQKKFNDKEKDDKRHFASAFKQNIENNREGIEKLISKASDSLNDAGNKHAQLFKDVCAEIEPAAQPISNSKIDSKRTRQDSPLLKAGQELFKKCRILVAVHEHANSKVSAQANIHTNERRALWKADMEQAQKAVVYGAQYSDKLIQCNVDMSSNDENKIQLLTPPPDVLNGPGQMALDMHQTSTKKLTKGASTWGQEALKYVDKFAGIAAVCELLAEDG